MNNSRPEIPDVWRGERNGWKTSLFHVKPGAEAELTKAIGGGATWHDNLGRPIGVSFGGTEMQRRRDFVKYGQFICLQLDTHTGQVIIHSMNEAQARYTIRQHGEKA